VPELDVYKDWLGIPEGPRPPDHYQLLRLVQFEDDAEKAQRNYKKLNAHVRKYATGKHSVRSQELLNELARAMLCLTDLERKREYDEGLGREFPEEEHPLGRKPLLKILVEWGSITREQAREVEAFGEARGLSMRDAVVQMKLVDAATATRAMAAELGLPYIELQDLLPDDSVLDHVPRKTVKRHEILPLFIDDDTVLVACVHEPTTELEEELRLRFGRPMRPVLATPLDVNQAIAKYYAPGARDESALADVKASGGKKLKGKSGKDRAEALEREPRIRFDELPPEEQQRRKQLGYIFMMWSVIGSVLIDQFVVKPYILPAEYNTPYVFVLAPIVAPLVIFWVLRVYWR
jgi:hypothetical protein